MERDLNTSNSLGNDGTGVQSSDQSSLASQSVHLQIKIASLKILVKRILGVLIIVNICPAIICLAHGKHEGYWSAYLLGLKGEVYLVLALAAFVLLILFVQWCFEADQRTEPRQERRNG